jgi:histidine kinase
MFPGDKNKGMLPTQVISGYELTEAIHEGAKTIIYRGKSLEKEQPVILKVLKDEYPTLDAVARLKHEYQIMRHLEHSGIIKAYQLQTASNRLMLVYEDFGGISLKQLLKTQQLSLEYFLEIAAQVVQAIAYLHRHEIIHKDIKPANIIINPHTGIVKLSDFSIASELYKESTAVTYPNEIEGSLAYMPPEQTGRMNRIIDFRSDFYSVGVTFYEMLTGKLPFECNEALEWVHCHIAKVPKAVEELNPNVPSPISQIVMKLMAKDAEDRYQSALGLLFDLVSSLFQIKTNGKIKKLIPGQRDSSGILLIPQKLYGREEEISTLLAAFERLIQEDEEKDEKTNSDSTLSNGTSRSELMLVSGYSGVGKSSLVKHMHKCIIGERCYFISGKFDQYQNVPYASLIQAFKSLIRQLLTESTTSLQIWREKLLASLGNNAQVIIDVIPELELIIGKQPVIPQLGLVETENRFHQVFQKFLRVFTQKEHPLVLFLDDLQWADIGSLKLIQLLISDNFNKHFLVIGTYRDNNINNTHPLREILSEIKQTGIKINHLEIKPLKINDVKQMLCESLSERENERIQNLASLLFNKTIGNPFLLIQILKTLHQEHLLKFDFAQGCWIWKIEDIQSLGITDFGVVELIARNIDRLPQTSQEILKLAACIGGSFKLDVLAISSEKTVSEVTEYLWSALQQGLILPLNKDYKFPLLFGANELDELGFDDSRLEYRFLHDKVQQAAYSLIPENQKQDFHLKIGKLLLTNLPENEVETNIFDIVNQFNISLENINNQNDKRELAKLNLIAGNKAKSSNAYELAFKYLTVGISLLNDSAWVDNYDITLNLYVKATEAAYLCNDFEAMDKFADVVLEKANNLLDKIPVYELKILNIFAYKQGFQAVELGLKVLNLLGINLPINPSKFDVLISILQTKLVLRDKHISELINLPQMTDPYSLAVMRITSTMSTAVAFTNPKLLSLLTSIQLQLSVRNGNCPLSCFAYTGYGTLICIAFNQIEKCCEFGELALKLSSSWSDESISAKLLNFIALYVFSWKVHWRENIPLFTLGIQKGLEVGDFEYVAWNYVSECQILFLVGEPLDILSEKMEIINQNLSGIKHEFIKKAHSLIWQAVLNLMGHSHNPCNLVGDVFNEEDSITGYRISDNFSFVFYYFWYKLVLGYLFCEYQQALDNVIKAEKYIDIIVSHPVGRVFYFYDSLTRLAVYYSLSKSEQKQVIKKVRNNQEKLAFWSKYAAMNFLHKHDLVEAELNRVLGKNFQAMEYYDRAIKGASENGYIQEEALANERAAIFYFTLKKEKIAKIYVKEAYYSYIRWGALAKVKDLESRYPFLISYTKETASADTAITSSSVNIKNYSCLDASTVVKASQALSKEIILSHLLDKFMLLVKENAGAQKVLFISKIGHQLVIESSLQDDNSDSITNSQSFSINDTEILPGSLINYVERTRENLVLDDAAGESEFNKDPYIVFNQPLSVLVLPIIQSGSVTGFLYLENNLTKGAFSGDRIEILEVLASQVAISLENARFYKTLEIRVAQRTQELQSTLEELHRTQLQLIQTEKMSSLGQLVGGVAHEINNPISFVYGNLTYAENYTKSLLELVSLVQDIYPELDKKLIDKITEIELDFIQDDLPKLFYSMQSGVERVQNIVESLRTFSRLDEAAIKKVNIHDGIESALLILQHKFGDIQLIKHYGNLPKINCYASQLNQVFMNLLANSIDALKEGIGNNSKAQPPIPTIWIRTEVVTKNQVSITFADNGVGMSQDVRNKIFDPFFTTKPVGKGTGLGLSISYQIVVELHGGELLCASTPSEGTEFTILLPYA